MEITVYIGVVDQVALSQADQTDMAAKLLTEEAVAEVEVAATASTAVVVEVVTLMYMVAHQSMAATVAMAVVSVKMDTFPAVEVVVVQTLQAVRAAMAMSELVFGIDGGNDANCFSQRW
jgi:hypothetical protein